MYKRLLIVAVFSVLISSALLAATFSISTTAPVVDGDDIAMLTETDADWGSSVIWGDRPARGQTFTTGANSTGYTLYSVTFKCAGNQADNGTYYIRVGTISGSDFTQIASDSVASTDDVVVDDYVTFILDTPATLAANTLHGVDLGRAGGGYMLYRNTDNASYTGGQAYNSGGSGVGGPTISTYTHDRVFHVDMLANAPAGTLFVFE